MEEVMEQCSVEQCEDQAVENGLCIYHFCDFKEWEGMLEHYGNVTLWKSEYYAAE
jgi:hypothetical protein